MVHYVIVHDMCKDGVVGVCQISKTISLGPTQIARTAVSCKIIRLSAILEDACKLPFFSMLPHRLLRVRILYILDFGSRDFIFLTANF